MARKGKAAPPAHPNIIVIDDKPYYLGLKWYSFADTPSREEIQEAADFAGAESYLLRDGENALQVGMCPDSVDDLPKQATSLAAYLADSTMQPWLGSFEVAPGRWWYIAVRDHNAILPDGDVVGDEATVAAAQNAHAGYSDWNYLGGTLDDLLRLVAEAKSGGARAAGRFRSVRTTPAERKRHMIVAGAITLGLSVLAGGGWYVNLAQEEEAMLARRANQQRIWRGKVDAAKAAFVSPFYTTPLPARLLVACRQIFASTPISQHGWMAEAITCTTTGATVEWLRGAGASVRHLPDGTTPDASGEKATGAIPFALSPAGDDVERLAPLNDLWLAFLAFAQEGGFAFHSAPVTPPSVPEGIDPRDLPPLVPAMSFVMSTTVSPLAMSEDFTAYPGLRITSLKESATGWRIEGMLYGTR